MGNSVSTRTAYGEALRELGADERVVVLDADLSCCNMTNLFAAQYPGRFFNVGIAEANMIDMAAGFAANGKIAFCNSFAMFTAGRGYDQIRNSVAYPGLNVKVVGSHGGLTVGEDGATHQCIEDLALMREIPGMAVLCPCDGSETRRAVRAMAEWDGPCYMRTGRGPVEDVTGTVPGYRFEIGKGVQLADGDDAAIAATGLMVQEAMAAAAILRKQGIHARVLDIHTIKPLDTELILKAARETGAIVTAENHSVNGALGSAVCELLSERLPTPVARVGVRDCFGRSGSAPELMKLYGLTPERIVEEVLRLTGNRKK